MESGAQRREKKMLKTVSLLLLAFLLLSGGAIGAAACWAATFTINTKSRKAGLKVRTSGARANPAAFPEASVES